MAAVRKPDAAPKRGRPTKYTRELADQVCAWLESGKGLRWIEQQPGMPAMNTIVGWDRDDRDGFSVRYAKARRVWIHRLAEETLEIADDGSRDYIDIDGKLVPNHELVQRARLRIDTRKWLACKLLPGVYGDAIKQEISGPDGGPVQHVVRVRYLKTDKGGGE